MPLGRALRDLVTIRRLLTTAETEARRVGDDHPAPADLLLAALALPDGTAARVFRRFGLDEQAVRTAISAARAEVSDSNGTPRTGLAGSRAAATNPAPTDRPNARRGVYRATPEAQAVFRSAVALTKETTPRSRLVGAHMVAASADLDHDVVARALRRLAIEPATLRTTACAEARDVG